MNYRLQKNNKRLYIFCDDGWYYTPPDFVAERLHSRDQMRDLLASLELVTPEQRIDVIRNFETHMIG